MMIANKQDLRRCVKQAVRRANVVETCFCFDVSQGECGIEAMLEHAAATSLGAEGTPLQRDALEAVCALAALDYPIQDLEKAQAMQAGYDRQGYLAQILRAMRARRVLVQTMMGAEQAAMTPDDRFAPCLLIPPDVFAPGRYGVDYAGVAQRIAQAASAMGARDVQPLCLDEQATEFCLAPLCEDECFVLHVQLQTSEQIAWFAGLMERHDRLRALAHATESIECELIRVASACDRLLVCLTDTSHLQVALDRLGTRFLAYSAGASFPEQMLGRWACAKEAIWQALYAAYLPLARAGYVLSAEAIERDVQRMLGEAYFELHIKP